MAAMAAMAVCMAVACEDNTLEKGSKGHAAAVLATGLSATAGGQRAAALDAVGLAQLEAFAPFIEGALKDEDARVRLAAHGAKIRLAAADSTAPLSSALGSGQVTVERALHFAAPQYPQSLIDVAVRSASESSDAAVRAKAVSASPLASDDIGERILKQALKDPDERVRDLAASLAGASGQNVASPQLIEKLLRAAPEARAVAARQLGERQDFTAVPALLHVAANPDGVLRPVALAATCRLGYAAGCEAAAEAFATREITVIAPTIDALSSVGGPRALSQLRPLAHHPEAAARDHLARTLSGTPHRDWAELLTPLLDDPAERTRAFAAVALVDHLPERALPIIEAVAASAHLDLRREVAAVLGRHYVELGRERTAPALRLLAHLDGAGREAPLDDGELSVVFTVLELLLTSGDDRVRRQAANDALTHLHHELRWAAARLVASGRCPDPGPALTGALDDDVPIVRFAAAAARLRPPR